jgi:hypothetical protein
VSVAAIATQRWLAGDLDAAVDVPIAIVCVALNLDATALAAAVRARLPPTTDAAPLLVRTPTPARSSLSRRPEDHVPLFVEEHER